jgi:uncharacterized membrane protein
MMMLGLSGFFALSRVAAWRGVTCQPLARFGRSSLFVYWIHVELVYGYASWLWRGKLPVWAVAIAYVVFCVLMYKAIDVRDRVVRWFKTRGDAGTAPEVFNFTT